MVNKHRRIRAAAVTGVGQLLGLLGSTLIGVLVAGTLPPSPRVDAFFAANQIYALSLYLGQSVRITAPALMLRGGLGQLSLYKSALVMAAATAVLMALVAVFGTTLVAEPSRSAFTTDLLILSPAAAVHVASGALAARLSVVGSFARAALAYAAGSVMSGLLLLATISTYGASALAPCIAAGGLTVGVVMVIGYRPFAVPSKQLALEDDVAGLAVLAPAIPIVPVATMRPGEVDAPGAAEPSLGIFGAEHQPLVDFSKMPDPGPWFATRRIGLGSVSALAMQLLITVVTLAAGHVVAGGTALLSYSFLALFAFTTIAITPMSVVLGPEVAARWDGGHTALAAIIRQATRLSVVFAVPLIVLAYFVGRPLAGLLLTALTQNDLGQVFTMLAILTPTLLFTAAATAATVGITAADRLGVLAAILSAICVAVGLAGLLLAVDAGSLTIVAIVAACFAVAFGVGTVFVAVGRHALPTLGAIIVENAPVFVPPLLVTFLLAPLVDTDLALGVLLSLPVLALHFGIVGWLRRDVVVLLVGAARQRAAA